MFHGNNRRVLFFALLLVASSVAFRSAVIALVNLSLNEDRYSYLSAIPIAAFGLIFFGRKTIFADSSYCPVFGFPLMVTGLILALKGQSLSAVIAGLVLVWIASFVLCFGLRVTRAAAFPLGFLLLTIPIPSALLDEAVSILQYNSAAMSDVLFKLFRVPSLRQGLTISLPGLNIEVAPQCSGIRSTTALILTTIVAGHFFLRSALNRVIVVLVTIPIVIFKNALRIATLSSLAVYVNQGFLSGRLHRYGGLCFSLLDLLILGPLFFYLHTSETRHQESST